MAKPLLVIGGNGLLGTAICKYAVNQGRKVLCLSRSTKRRYTDEWQSQVEYVQGDAMETSSYEKIIPEVSGVVHTLGTLIDSRTPLKIRDTYQGSYEQVNRDSALKVLSVVEKSPVPFVYISAAKGWFFLPGYIETKREVEEYLKKNSDKLTYTVLRPGIMYGQNEQRLKIVSSIVDLIHTKGKFLNSLGLTKDLSYFPAKTLDIDQVAKAAVESVYNPKLHNQTLEVSDIENLA